MKPRALLLFALAALVGATAAVLPALAAAPSEVKLEVNENCVDAAWPCWATPGSGPNPQPASKVTIAAGGEIVFTDHDASAPTTVSWMGSAPTMCSGIPASPASNWEGKCKFELPGTYKFESAGLWEGDGFNFTKYEVMVEGTATGTTTTMTTTTTPTTTTTTAPTTPGEPSQGSPLEGGSKALKLARDQRGSAVRGSIDVSQAGTGGQLEVALFATDASLAKAGHGHRAQVRVGRLVRSSLKAGSVSFSVRLGAKGRAALRRHRRLALTVKLTLTPSHGAAATISRGVLMRA